METEAMEKYLWWSEAAEELRAEWRKNGRIASLSSFSALAYAFLQLNMYLLLEMATGVFMFLVSED